MVYQINQEALQKYRLVSQLNTSYSEAQDSYQGDAFVNTIESNKEYFASPQTKSTRNKKTLKDKSPSSVDRSLRNQGWVGGHAPVEFGTPKRSWKPKKKLNETSSS